MLEQSCVHIHTCTYTCTCECIMHICIYEVVCNCMYKCDEVWVILCYKLVIESTHWQVLAHFVLRSSWRVFCCWYQWLHLSRWASIDKSHSHTMHSCLCTLWCVEWCLSLNVNTHLMFRWPAVSGYAGCSDKTVWEPVQFGNNKSWPQLLLWLSCAAVSLMRIESALTMILSDSVDPIFWYMSQTVHITSDALFP